MDSPNITRIAACRGCGQVAPETFFDLGSQALANGLLPRADAPEHTFPLELSRCDACGLVQLNHTVDPSALFSHYVWVTGTAAATRAYADQFCAMAAAGSGLQTGRRYVLEVASNDGTFLKPFLARGYRVLGVDPAANIAALAERGGVPTRVGFFGSKLAADLVAEQGPASLVFARNVLPHVADPDDFVRGLCVALAPDGFLVLELHDGRIIAEGLHYDSVYHEHLCYFTAHTVGALLAKHGLQVIDVARSPISGGSVVLTVARDGVRRPSPAVRTRLVEEHTSGANELKTWLEFARRSHQHAHELRRVLEAECAAGRTVAGYGASARSSTLINVAALGPFLTLIADQNELKHGMWSPGAHIPICAPGDLVRSRPATVLVLAWNFFDEIVAALRGPLGFQGRIIRPLPDITIHG